MPALERNSAKIIARLKKEGWEEVSKKGSHLKLRHPASGSTIVVPHPKKDLPMGTARSIAKHVGWLE